MAAHTSGQMRRKTLFTPGNGPAAEAGFDIVQTCVVAVLKIITWRARLGVRTDEQPGGCSQQALSTGSSAGT